jgi:hypothetical protein
LSTSGAVFTKRRPGRPAKVATVVAPKGQKIGKRRKMSAEGRERIRQVQIKRWAAQEGTSQANMNATVAPLPTAATHGGWRLSCDSEGRFRLSV